MDSIALISRWLHILAAMAAVGGPMFIRLAILPAMATLPEIERKQLHEQVRRRLPVDDIKICLHVDADKCECRKPMPGMLLEAALQHQIELPKSYLVGDRWRDIQAGAAAGCRTIFVDYDYPQDGSMQPDWVVRSLPEAVAIILDQENR